MTTSRRIAELAGKALEAKSKAQLNKELTFAEIQEIAASALSQTQDNSTRPPAHRKTRAEVLYDRTPRRY
jgi:hypothetical protein